MSFSVGDSVQLVGRVIRVGAKALTIQLVDGQAVQMAPARLTKAGSASAGSASAGSASAGSASAGSSSAGVVLMQTKAVSSAGQIAGKEGGHGEGGVPD